VKTGTVTIGGSGDGTFLVDGDGARFDATDVFLGKHAGSTGKLNLVDGKVNATSVAVGVQGNGIVTQTGGDNAVHPYVSASADTSSDAIRGRLSLALSNGSEGLYDFRKGKLFAESELVAGNSVATFKQVGGSNTTTSATIGAGTHANGTYKLISGSLDFQRNPTKPQVGLIVGDSGTGALAIGDASGSGAISEVGSGAPISAIVRADADGDGRIVGWGSIALHGNLQQNGKVIADGDGKPHDLNLSTFASITNDIDNAPGGDNGFFARHGGRLLLPPIDITRGTSSVTWGEGANDPNLDLINSARFTFTGVENPGKHAIALMAADRPDVPTAPAGVQFASVWHGDFDSLGADRISAILRYDDTFSPGIAAGNVQLWTYNSGAWQDQSPAAILDIKDRLISATVVPTDWFAVSTISNTAILPNLGDPTSLTPSPLLGTQVPEPASICMLALGAAFLTTRRRRR
jgi:hypothetical protein